MDQKMKVRTQKKMTIVTRKIIRGSVTLLVALGIITFGINSFTAAAQATAPAAPYVTNMSVSVNGGQPPTTGGPTGVYWTGPPDQEWGTCTSNCMPTGGSMFTITYKIQFADATPGASVYCYVYVHDNPRIYSTNVNLTMSFSTDGSNVYGFCYAQVGNGPQSAQISLP